MSLTYTRTVSKNDNPVVKVSNGTQSITVPASYVDLYMALLADHAIAATHFRSLQSTPVGQWGKATPAPAAPAPAPAPAPTQPTAPLTVPRMAPRPGTVVHTMPAPAATAPAPTVPVPAPAAPAPTVPAPAAPASPRIVRGKREYSRVGGVWHCHVDANIGRDGILRKAHTRKCTDRHVMAELDRLETAPAAPAAAPVRTAPAAPAPAATAPAPAAPAKRPVGAATLPDGCDVILWTDGTWTVVATEADLLIAVGLA